jgi:lipopolysaccharide transport system ATP-binding protein
MQPVIKVENISKQYRLGNVGSASMKDDILRLFAKVRGNQDPFFHEAETNDRTIKGDSNYVWSLKDINFEVQQGEVLGIIGKNGAGKSTLLKILSRVTAPTTGNIKVRGRIASLLEVGTGFHPELTGRENIFLNGAILGMRKHEIKSKFEEILDFAGVERFIDTPVKRYSSGMYVRLAFAVAAHLEPEILIIDEVLAVGDAEFQKKCLGKMKDVSNAGRTVLFVSHNLAAVRSLCNKGLLLNNGQIDYWGDLSTCIQRYNSGFKKVENQRVWNKSEGLINGIELIEATINGQGKDLNDATDMTDALEFKLKLNKVDFQGRLDITLHLKDSAGEKLFSFSSAILESIEKKGNVCYKCIIPSNFFNVGKFSLDLYLVEERKSVLYIEQDFLEFTINNKPIEFGQYMGNEPGALHPHFNWSTEKVLQ